MQGSQKDSGDLEIIWIIVGVLALLLGIFVIFRAQILTVVLTIKYFELRTISFFMVNQHYESLSIWLNQQDPNRVSLDELSLLSSEIGNTIKYPCIFLCFFFAIVIYFKHPKRFFRETENMHTLAQKVSTIFPAINVTKGVNLVKTPINTGPWAMAMTPIEFMKLYTLGIRDPKTGKITIDQYKTKLAFTKQLGPLFPGIDALAPHEKAIFAILSAFINYKRDEGEAAMEAIVGQITPEQIKKKKIPYHTDNLLKKYRKTAPVEAILKKHAYTSTVFTQMLVEARQSGIILNSLMLWLKPIDRNMWYVINNVGRKAVFIEAAAVHAHWLSEKRLGFAIKQAMIDEAIFALDEAIQSRIVREL